MCTYIVWVPYFEREFVCFPQFFEKAASIPIWKGAPTVGASSHQFGLVKRMRNLAKKNTSFIHHPDIPESPDHETMAMASAPVSASVDWPPVEFSHPHHLHWVSANNNHCPVRRQDCYFTNAWQASQIILLAKRNQLHRGPKILKHNSVWNM